MTFAEINKTFPYIKNADCSLIVDDLSGLMLGGGAGAANNNDNMSAENNREESISPIHRRGNLNEHILYNDVVVNGGGGFGEEQKSAYKETAAAPS